VTFDSDVLKVFNFKVGLVSSGLEGGCGYDFSDGTEHGLAFEEAMFVAEAIAGCWRLVAVDEVPDSSFVKVCGFEGELDGGGTFLLQWRSFRISLNLQKMQ
jgi:hypothetical protein